MQPRSTDISPNSTESASSETVQSTQHGQLHHDGSPDPGLHEPGLDSELRPSLRSRTAALSLASGTSSTEDKGPREHTGGISGYKSGKRTPSPVDRIIEHELASPKYVHSKDSSPGFRVIARPKDALALKISLHQLPAEVLTHVCSYLPADAFSSMALVSRKLHQVVTEQHAWRMAFARFFPGHESMKEEVVTKFDRAGEEVLASEKRFFNRLTPLSSWRSEYIIRTRLLRSLSKGSPSDIDNLTGKIGPRSSTKAARLSQVDYNVEMEFPVTRIEGRFEMKSNRPHVRLVHGSHEDCHVTLSNPIEAKWIPWSFARTPTQFYESFPAVEMYGLGVGEVVGVPNSMDISTVFGIIIGNGTPGGSVYHRHIDEQHGKYLAKSINNGVPELGIPRVDPDNESITAVWLAKTRNIPTITKGTVGALFGSSTGIVTACSLGMDGISVSRSGSSEISARWVLSPGVPIIALNVDEHFSARRLKQDRIWAIALNALGEVFYLKDIPCANPLPGVGARDEPSEWQINVAAWKAGRTVSWHIIEPTRRLARPDPFGDLGTDASYSPRSSSNAYGLSSDQIAAETREIEKFIRKPPILFRESCEGWDMQRCLEADFAGDDEHGAGEAVFVIARGLHEGQRPSVKRYTRLLIEDAMHVAQLNSPARKSSPPPPRSSVFGGAGAPVPESNVWAVKKPLSIRRMSHASNENLVPVERFEVWHTSNFTFGGLKAVQITTTARDMSTYANLTIDEDPLLSLNPVSMTWSPSASPMGRNQKLGTSADVPGQRSRLFAAGTRIGSVLIWNMRAPVSTSSELINDIEPLRIVYTDSPGISSLAMTALYLVHGGNDGLVQAWDPLASTKEPIRTLHSKFTQRARRDLRQNQARPQGIGINGYAAGAICLDPDSKVLRGVVSIGPKLRYWSYSSTAADSYRGSKRRSQRDRGTSNQTADAKIIRTGRGALADYIANEQVDLERHNRERQRETERFNARYGANLLGEGATDDEIMAYATMISEEALASDHARRMSITSSGASTIASSPGGVLLPEASIIEESDSENDAQLAKAFAGADDDLAEALRRSLQEHGSMNPPKPKPGDRDLNFTIRFAKDKRGKSPKSQSPVSALSPSYAGGSNAAEGDDLEYALQLSLAEEQSRQEIEERSDSLRQLPRLTGSVTNKGRSKSSRRGS